MASVAAPLRRLRRVHRECGTAIPAARKDGLTIAASWPTRWRSSSASYIEMVFAMAFAFGCWKINTIIVSTHSVALSLGSVWRRSKHLFSGNDFARLAGVLAISGLAHLSELFISFLESQA
jgi:hypothetical protein